MSIRHLTYTGCDCCGDPAECADNATEARAQARAEGWARRRRFDICRKCNAPGHPICGFGSVYSPGVAHVLRPSAARPAKPPAARAAPRDPG